jgi:hypothetical protein
MISLISKKKSCVALSMVEEEYVAECSSSHEVVWLRKLLIGLFDIAMESTYILYDHHSCIHFSENMVFHDRSKIIEIMHQYIMDMVHN